MGRTMLALADGSITTSAMLNTPVVGHAQHESMKQSMFAMTVVEASVARISRRTALAGAGSIALVLLGASACGFPRPADVSGDAAVDVPGGTDGSAGPIVAIHVSPSGDDSNDGLVSPVKTLKHAIGLAADNTQISQIILATGHLLRVQRRDVPLRCSTECDNRWASRRRRAPRGRQSGTRDDRRYRRLAGSRFPRLCHRHHGEGNCELEEHPGSDQHDRSAG